MKLVLQCSWLCAGKLEVQVGKENKTFGITRAHLEEDAGELHLWAFSVT